MLLVLLTGGITATIMGIMWYLHVLEEQPDGDYYFPNEICFLGILAFFTGLTFLGFAIGAIISSSGHHSDENLQLINSRHVILAELSSTDAATHNKGISDAVNYNQSVKSGKEQLANPWVNWLTDRIWADAEYIEVNLDEYEIIPEVTQIESEVFENAIDR